MYYHCCSEVTSTSPDIMMGITLLTFSSLHSNRGHDKGFGSYSVGVVRKPILEVGFERKHIC